MTKPGFQGRQLLWSQPERKGRSKSRGSRICKRDRPLQLDPQSASSRFGSLSVDCGLPRIAQVAEATAALPLRLYFPLVPVPSGSELVLWPFSIEENLGIWGIRRARPPPFCRLSFGSDSSNTGHSTSGRASRAVFSAVSIVLQSV